MPHVQALTTSLKLNLYRAGGYNNDAEKSTGSYGSDPFTGTTAVDTATIDAYIDYCVAVGAQPVLQVPIIDNYKQNGGKLDPADAAAIVTYCNKTKSYDVKYWEIGNEPDLYASGGDLAGYSVARFIADFQAMASAMKQVDPSIKILGPELSWMYYPNQTGSNDWLTPFLQECSGKDSNGNYYVDYLTIHRYPFDASQCTIANAMGDVKTYNSFVRQIQSYIPTRTIGGRDIPFGITEANISWDGNPSDSIYAASPQTIYAAMWVVDTLCAAREQGLWSQFYWSTCESWTIGFINPSGYSPRPEYYGFKLVTNNMGSDELKSTPPSGFSVYSSRNGTNTVVMVLNKNATNNTETFSFSNMGSFGSSPISGFSATFPAYSISCVTFPDSGGSPMIYRYSGTEASEGSGPAIVQ
jgi:hypothetical protein